MINYKLKSIILNPVQIEELCSQGKITIESGIDLSVNSIFWVKEFWFKDSIKIHYRTPEKNKDHYNIPSTMKKAHSRFKVKLIDKSSRKYLTFSLIEGN